VNIERSHFEDSFQAIAYVDTVNLGTPKGVAHFMGAILWCARDIAHARGVAMC